MHEFLAENIEKIKKHKIIVISSFIILTALTGGIFGAVVFVIGLVASPFIGGLLPSLSIKNA